MTPATLQNIQRKSAYADHVQMIDGIPLFSWVDLNITELCNRVCVFCPRASASTYPNQNLHMAIPLAAKIASELQNLAYEGAVILSGFGESLLHPRIYELVKVLGRRGLHIELVTNGDRLTSTVIRNLIELGIDYFVVSLYDGPHQVEAVNLRFVEAGCSTDQYILRDRWYGPERDFGLKLTNRAGTIQVGNQPTVPRTQRCFYPSYAVMIDWNGDVLLCVQDWNKQIRFGNLNDETLLSIWTGPAMMRWRTNLAVLGRSQKPCSGCNAEGTLHGRNHTKAWKLLP